MMMDTEFKSHPNSKNIEWDSSKNHKLQKIYDGYLEN